MKSAVKNSAPIIGLILILFISLYSISDATSDSAFFEQYYDLLVFFNVLALILLLGLIVYNLYKLVVQYRLKQIGSQLTARMLVIFAILAIVPVTIVYYFSQTFIHRSIDSWFDVGIENALEDSLALSKSALDVRKREALKKTQTIALDIPSVTENLMIVFLNDARSKLLMNELTLIGPNKSIIASSSDNSAELPNALSYPDIVDLGLDNHYLALESADEDTVLQIRVVVPVLSNTPTTKPWQLHALYPITDQINELSLGVEVAFEKYKELSDLREPLKYSFTLALSVIWLLSVLSAIWIAFLAAKKLVAPINELVEGTRAVAAGDYEKQLTLSGSDELGFLLRSFNTMTRKISRSRQQVEESQTLEAVQRAYLESVLEHISSGVLTFDSLLTLKKANTSAGEICGIEVSQCSDCTIDNMIEQYAFMQPLLDEIKKLMLAKQTTWQTEMSFFGNSGRKILQLRGAAFVLDNNSLPSHVVVIDDLTDLISAQKNNAWSEMARRLAHEIKNPLTPIQLSAERLDKKLGDKVGLPEQEMLHKYTSTIIQQVEAMRIMVNSFTDYARSSDTHSDDINLNHMITEVSALYEPQAKLITLDLASALPHITGDAVRIRQIMHNLVKNAIEAQPNDPLLTIKTVTAESMGCKYIDILFIDRGEGINEETIQNIFEPYMTTKSFGTGLGLAIVKKIVEEHGGIVWAENNSDQGASLNVRFPSMKLLESNNG